MLIYGICVDEIKNNEIDWDKVEKLLESYDSSLHGDFKEYVNYDDSKTPEEQEYWKKEWFLAYDSMGHHGLGAFLHDVIEKEEQLDLKDENKAKVEHNKTKSKKMKFCRVLEPGCTPYIDYRKLVLI